MNYQLLALYSQVVSSILFAALCIYGFQHFISPAIIASQKARNDEIKLAEQRRDEIVSEAQALKMQLEGLSKALEETRARSEVEARRERERIIAEARAGGERLVRHADGELERARNAGQANFQARLIHAALDKARVLATHEVSPERDHAFTQTFLTQIPQGEPTLAEVSRG